MPRHVSKTSAALALSALFAVACKAERVEAPLALGDESCPELSCLPCGTGSDCAESGPFLGDTCCGLGDSLVEIGVGEAHEIVDIEIDDRYVYMCGGFGGRAYDVTDPGAPVDAGGIAGRCQRIAVGPLLDDGSRVIYIAHHGDTRWVTPYLQTMRMHPDREPERLDLIEADDVLFEGLAWSDGALYAATHAGGLRVYATDDAGIPSFSGVVGGFENASKVTVDSGFAYVTDEAGLEVLSLADPLSPVLVAEIQTAGKPRDVAVAEGRLYAALGGAGLDVFDVSAAATPARIEHVALPGSTQAVAVDGDLISVASWSHVALLSADSFDEVSRENIHGALGQSVGVAMRGGRMYAAEWGTGLHVLEQARGVAAPDLWLDDGVFSFRGDATEARAVIVRNRGLVELSVTDIEVDHPRLSVSHSSLRVLPGDAAFLELSYDPIAIEEVSATLTLRSNDPDRPVFEVPIRVGTKDLLRAGDSIDERFGFLDPDGAGQVSGLDGHVVLLAYFGVW